MRVTEVLPVPGETVDVSTPQGREWLAAHYRVDAARFVRLNMVTTLTGAASGDDGTSDTITSRTDRMILGAIRAAADVVVVGAASVRAEGYLVPRSATLAVVSRSGRLDGHRLQDAEPGRVLMLVPAHAVVDPIAGVELVRIADESGGTSPRGVLDALAERGLRRVVCEGGPSLASQFADAGAIDEYCVTVAPRITPAAAPFLSPGTVLDAVPVGLLADAAGFSYLRLRSVPGVAAS